MPLYACFIQEGALTRAQKAEIAGEITRIHCDLTGAPPSFVHVRFHTMAPGDGYTGGKPAKSAVLDASVRAGRPHEVNVKLLQELSAMYQRISGIPEWDLVVAIREIPASHVMEAGHILPEPSEEKEWFEKHGASWEAA
jgi:phenylpyruvate tautomerase PptA (4-oxalocrotonate tautomerase family)